MSGLISSVGSKSNIVGTGGLGNMVSYRASSASTLTGWSEYTSARGRMIVGLPASGTDGGTVGTIMTDELDRSKSIAHTHTISDHQHEIGVSLGSTKFAFQVNMFGTNGTLGAERYITPTADHSGPSVDKGVNSTPTTNPASGAMSANAAVVTSDILAYIQLMVIKKD